MMAMSTETATSVRSKCGASSGNRDMSLASVGRMRLGVNLVRQSTCVAPIRGRNDGWGRPVGGGTFARSISYARMPVPHYDLAVIGSGPAGQKGAIAAAKMRKRVAVVDKKKMIGGVCVNTGTVPSKTFREAVLYLTGLSQRSFYGRAYAVKDNISMQDLM